jgi:two-component system, cell cycle sensor histidine kinase and response regulator CckA
MFINYNTLFQAVEHRLMQGRTNNARCEFTTHQKSPKRLNLRDALILHIGFGVLLGISFSPGVRAAERIYRAALPHVPGVMYRNADGTPGGFAAELLVHVARDEQLKLEWLDGSWNDLYEKTRAGEIDVLINTQVTAERQRFLDYLDAPLYVMWSELYVHHDTDFRSIQQLEGKKVAIVSGDNNAAGFIEYIASFHIKWQEVAFESHQAGIKALQSKKVFAMAGPTPELLGDAFTGIKRSGLVFNPNRLSIAFPKGKATALRSAVNRRLAEYRKDPESALYQLMRKYKVGKFVEERTTMPRWLRGLVLVLIVLSAMSLLFILVLRTQVKRKTSAYKQINKKLWQAAEIAQLGQWDYSHSEGRVELSTHMAAIIERDTTDKPPTMTLEELRAYIHDDDRDMSDAEFQSSIQQRQTYNFEHRIVTETGKVKWVQASGYHEFDGNVPVSTFGIIIDITARVNAQNELKHTTEQLNHSERMESVGQLAGGIAHDFNNMLSGILGYADLLLDESDPKKIQTYSSQIVSAAEKAASLTSQLLAFARKDQLLMQPVSLHGAIESAISLLKRTIDKKIRIVTHLDADEDTVWGDSASLTNAILNMAINSRDAMDKDGGILTISTREVHLTEDIITTSKYQISPGNTLKLSISDTGTGISQELLNKIFEPFFTTKPLGKGTGLGLSAVYGTIKSHQGALDIESEPQKGTTVTVYLPTYKTDNPQRSDTHRTEATGGERSLRILLVEDEPTLRSLGSRMLQAEGHVVLDAGNGKEGARLFDAEGQALDAVILDLQMPEMNGMELLRHIRAQLQTLPILAVSGFSDTSDDNHFPTDEYTGFLSKPYRKTDLLKALYRLIHHARETAR